MRRDESRMPASADILPAPAIPPGQLRQWRGLARLTDIAIGYSLRSENMGG